MVRKLNNGATVLEETRLNDDQTVVLAVWREGSEYVTWIVGNDGEAYWGRYFLGDFVGAAASYVERGGAVKASA